MPHYLICYDIANPKRLGKVHRRAVNHAVFVQYSVYYLQGTRAALDIMLDELREVIDDSQDDVRAYMIAPLSESIQFGRSWIPDGIIISND